MKRALDNIASKLSLAQRGYAVSAVVRCSKKLIADSINSYWRPIVNHNAMHASIRDVATLTYFGKTHDETVLRIDSLKYIKKSELPHRLSLHGIAHRPNL